MKKRTTRKQSHFILTTLLLTTVDNISYVNLESYSMIHPQSCAFILIDMQEGFLNSKSSLCVPNALNTIPACARALKKARESDMYIVHAIRSYASDGSNVEITRFDQWKKDKALSSEAADFCSAAEPAELSPTNDEYILVKPRFSAFFDTDLHTQLQKRGITTVVLAGTTTPNCIRSTCYDALSYDYNVIVLEDCTSARTEEVQHANIADMAFIGATILSCEKFEQDGLTHIEDMTSRVRGAIA